MVLLVGLKDMRCATVNTKILGVILAGGKSKRMGKDKGLLEINGKTLLTHTIDILKAVKPKLHKIVVSGKKGDASLIQDIYQNLGPVGGIYSVMQAVRNHSENVGYLLVVPVDMPLMTSDTLSNLIAKREPLQRFNAFIYKDKYLPLLLRVTDKILAQFEVVVKQALNTSKTSSLQNLLAQLNTYELTWNELGKQTFTNVNTQEEWDGLYQGVI